ncbi:MAG: hypothetical protein QW369_06265 [Desulfurococcaceae archaeon]
MLKAIDANITYIGWSLKDTNSVKLKMNIAIDTALIPLLSIKLALAKIISEYSINATTAALIPLNTALVQGFSKCFAKSEASETIIRYAGSTMPPVATSDHTRPCSL